MDDLIAFLRVRLDERDFQYGQAPEVYGWEIADVAAKRQIIDAAQRADEAGEAALQTASEYARSQALMDVVELLALPYADHPDYREEWRP